MQSVARVKKLKTKTQFILYHSLKDITRDKYAYLSGLIVHLLLQME